MRIGIRDGCLRMPWDEALQAAAEIGFDGVELDIGAGYRETPLWRDGVGAVQAMAEKAGSKVLAFCAGACWQISPASPDDDVRAEIRTLLTDLSGFAAELGAGAILVPVTPGGEDVPYEDEQRRWIEEMKELAPVAESTGVILALENVGRGCGKSAEELIHLADGVGSPGVQVYYDIGNATAFENDPVEEIKLLGSRIAVVHVKDRDGDLLGDGIVKIPESIEALKGIGYDGDLILETPATDDARAAAAHNLRYLQALV
ncbi:MAG: sugar phosphate isomerase/epimerase family protein [Armatimonadota bacterium]